MAPLAVMPRKPTPLEMLSKKTQYRPPRIKKDKDGKTKEDSPQAEYSSGASTVVLGVSAMVFAAMRMKRIATEKTLIKKMWDQHTTIRGLRLTAEAGEALPETVMVRGWLSARGPGVRSLAAQVPQLSARIGRIDQPENSFLRLAEKVKVGDVDAPEDIKAWSQKAHYHDTFTSTQRSPLGNLLVRELLVTRLGCEALRKETKNKHGVREVEITRHPRQARFNVFHERSVAEGLHVVGLAGEAADLELPTYGEAELRAGEAPSLFLSAPDAIREFKEWSGVSLVNADKPLTHLSRFIHLDRTSTTDDGSFEPDGESRRRSSSSVAISGGGDTVAALGGGEGALAALGALRPSGWLWNGKGFYDNNSSEQSWMSHHGTAMVSFGEYVKRLATAREENCRHQRASEWDYATMQARRDGENCFRFVELGISASEVVVVAKPHFDEHGHRIVLRAPEKKAADEAQFEFRILRGHTAEQLLKHRNVSIQVFVGFTLMGLATIIAGEEMMRDSIEIVSLS